MYKNVPLGAVLRDEVQEDEPPLGTARRPPGFSKTCQDKMKRGRLGGVPDDTYIAHQNFAPMVSVLPTA